MRPPAHLPSRRKAGEITKVVRRTQTHSVARSRTQSHSVACAPLEAVLDTLVGAQDELESISRAKGAYAVGREGDRIGTCGERVMGRRGEHLHASTGTRARSTRPYWDPARSDGSRQGRLSLLDRTKGSDEGSTQ